MTKEEEQRKKQIFENLEKSKKGIPIGKRVRDKWQKGITLHPSYREDWDYIHQVFDNYCIDLSHHGPIITMQTREEVELADRIAKVLMKDPKIRKFAEKVCFPLRNVYPNPRITEKQLIDGTIFIIALRLVPSFCMKVGMQHLKQFLENGIKYDVIKPIFGQHGTIRDTQKGFEESVRRMVDTLTKNYLNR